jgi:hypothetical protein
MTTLRKLNPLRMRFVILVIFVIVIACSTMLSRTTTTTTTLTIVNNTSSQIRHVYLSAPDSNNWGSDQLGSSVIAAGGGSVSLTISCEGASVKVIAEDHEGCFFYQVVSCGNAASWTIASNAQADCGNR